MCHWPHFQRSTSSCSPNSRFLATKIPNIKARVVVFFLSKNGEAQALSEEVSAVY